MCKAKCSQLTSNSWQTKFIPCVLVHVRQCSWAFFLLFFSSCSFFTYVFMSFSAHGHFLLLFWCMISFSLWSALLLLCCSSGFQIWISMQMLILNVHIHFSFSSSCSYWPSAASLNQVKTVKQTNKKTQERTTVSADTFLFGKWHWTGEGQLLYGLWLWAFIPRAVGKTTKTVFSLKKNHQPSELGWFLKVMSREGQSKNL